MLRFLTMFLTLDTANALGGRTCTGSSGDDDQCKDGVCQINMPSRRRTSRVVSIICLGGVYQNVWYNTGTTELQCNASRAENIEKSLPANYPDWGHSGYTTDAAFTKAVRGGQCFNITGQHYGAGIMMSKHTCEGVPDGGQPLRKEYNGNECTESMLSSSVTMSNGRFHGHEDFPCLCTQTQPSSDCWTCDGTAQFQCSTEEMCTNEPMEHSETEGDRCTFSGGSCNCAAGKYETEGVCFGGQLYNVYFQGVTYSECLSVKAGTYMKFPTSSRRRGATTCRDESGSVLDGTVSKEYMSKISKSCSGIADGQKAREAFYDAASCGGTMFHRANDGVSEDVHLCRCADPGREPESSCESCSGYECSTQDSCTRSKEKSCSWDQTQQAGSECSCAANIFQRNEACWDGQLAELVYDMGADSGTQCTNMANGSNVIVRPSNPDDWGSDTECRDNGDQEYAKRLYCGNVPNGGLPVKAIYSDSSCTTLTRTEANQDSESRCDCERMNGCKVDTTFEKYYCATSETDSSIIAVEFSDRFCTTPTGVNRTIPSVSDALNPGVCGAWPPIALTPDFDISVILNCSAKDQPPMYNTWQKSGSTPSCGAQSAADTGSIDGCSCKSEYYFAEQAMEQNVQISGGVDMEVSDVDAAIASSEFKEGVREGIADTAGVSTASVAGLTLEKKTNRRLEATDRRSLLAEFANELASETVDFNKLAEPRFLASGSITASYVIVVPKARETAVKSTVTNVANSALSQTITQKVAAKNVQITATVTAVAAPVAAPAVIAVTSTGEVVAEGVSPDGNAITTTNPNAGSTGPSSSGEMEPGAFVGGSEFDKASSFSVGFAVAAMLGIVALA